MSIQKEIEKRKKNLKQHKVNFNAINELTARASEIAKSYGDGIDNSWVPLIRANEIVNEAVFVGDELHAELLRDVESIYNQLSDLMGGAVIPEMEDLRREMEDIKGIQELCWKHQTNINEIVE